MSCPASTVELRRAIYRVDISPFLTTIVLCLSIRIRGYDDPNFYIPSAALTLHLCSREIVSESFVRSWIAHGTLQESVLHDRVTSLQDGCMEQLHGLDLSPMSAVGSACLARMVRYQLRRRDCRLPDSRNLCAPVVSDQPTDPFCFHVDISQKWVLFFGREN